MWRDPKEIFADSCRRNVESALELTFGLKACMTVMVHVALTFYTKDNITLYLTKWKDGQELLTVVIKVSNMNRSHHFANELFVLKVSLKRLYCSCYRKIN